MTNGMIQTKKGFAIKDFESGEITFTTGPLRFSSYQKALDACRGKFFPTSYSSYLSEAAGLDRIPDADTWENMIYANDPRGVWDGERKEYRNVSSMDRGAATESEIAYVDALDATYKSLVAMVKNK